MADRFLYVKISNRLAACQPNLGPAEYDHHERFKQLTQIPCTTVIVSLFHSPLITTTFCLIVILVFWQKTLDIPKENQADYKYVG